ncbi:hypothetical protein BOX15_Mlig009482g1 [Macrostomum lignano]|uniref:CBM21 domain-containing protein n=1 Tax=Macrostomum lignano TaxID=282301 RepID=A0A267EPB2_9PLAT|nr:hypothetical protein BOX15_Mlig009482g2 [Macrostomum lignano]PAA62814.1 hypothetical protein BOX15_Mlig009482g1 [Macrostomum lignano]
MSSDIETQLMPMELQAQSGQFYKYTSNSSSRQMQQQAAEAVKREQQKILGQSDQNLLKQKQKQSLSQTEQGQLKQKQKLQQQQQKPQQEQQIPQKEHDVLMQQLSRLELHQQSEKVQKQANGSLQTSAKQQSQQNGEDSQKKSEKPSQQQLPRLLQKELYLEHQEQMLSQSLQLPEMRRVASCGFTYKSARSKGLEERKRVQFADEMGLDLTQVRLMREPSWVPPVLPREILANLPLPKTEVESTSESESEATLASTCQYNCRFEQPVSRYVLFRENLERNCVSLSSLHFEGCTARGIVNVKNVCFDKRVFVRVSFDSWRSYKDFDAKYLSLCDGGAHDSFSFTFQCPTPAVDFEFCVCFEALSLGQSFWDNAVGQNYQVSAAVPSKKKKKQRKKSRSPVAAAADPIKKFTSSYRPSFERATEFSEYAAWEQQSIRVYY